MAAVIRLLAAMSLMLAVPALPQTVDPRTINDGMPPVRFMRALTVVVAFDTLSECGTPPPGYVFKGCVRDGIVHMPSPCAYGYR